MALNTALVGLETQILAAFKKAQLSRNSESATAALARDLALAIHTYALQTSVNPGQAVVVATPAGPGSGATISPGTVS